MGLGVGEEVTVDEVGVHVDEAGHALAARRDETELGDGLHLREPTRPPQPRWLGGDLVSGRGRDRVRVRVSVWGGHRR